MQISKKKKDLQEIEAFGQKKRFSLLGIRLPKIVSYAN